MEHIKTLLARYYQTAFIFFIGVMLIVYVALIVLYVQQAPQKENLQSQITRLSAILRNPLPNMNALNNELEAVRQALAPIADNDTIAMLVALAEESGIDVSDTGGKFQVPVPSHSVASVGGGSYQVTSFPSIRVIGDSASAWAFISALDSGAALPNLVLTRLTVEETDITPGGPQFRPKKTQLSAIMDVAIYFKAK